MNWLNQLKAHIKRTPLISPYIVLKGNLTSLGSQADEARILRILTTRFQVPKRFIEFGFSGYEYNCIELARSWKGLLVDGDPYNQKIARILLHERVAVECFWITLESIHRVIEYAEESNIGVLSVDVDGNDFWFLERLIPLKPSIIVAEYNSSFGLRPLTVPYEDGFDRTKKHPTWTYYGASLTAIHHLCTEHDYGLVELSNSGVNAFFVRNELLTKDDMVLNPAHCFREKYFPDGSRPSQQWERIKHLPFVDVTSR